MYMPIPMSSQIRVCAHVDARVRVRTYTYAHAHVCTHAYPQERMEISSSGLPWALVQDWTTEALHADFNVSVAHRLGHTLPSIETRATPFCNRALLGAPPPGLL